MGLARMKYCNKCGSKTRGTEKFCRKCGVKIEIRTIEHEKKEHKRETKHKEVVEHRKPHRLEPWHYPWIVIGILLIISAIILLPTKVVSYQVEVPYINTEQYTVEVPYEDVEEYIVQVPYETEETYIESVPVQEQEEYLDKVCSNQNIKYTMEWVKCTLSGESSIKFTNIDSEGGTFVINIGYITNSGQFVGNPASKYISPASSATFTYSPTPSSFYSCDYKSQSIPTKQVCDYEKKYRIVTNYKDVIKTRTVTKYRDETRYRKVTKTRDETREKEVRKTRTETKQKEVNWIFGFDAIIKFKSLE